MVALNFFKKKKTEKKDVNREFEEMFGNKLDDFAKNSFGVDLKHRNNIEIDSFIDQLNKNDIPSCSDHARNKFLYAMKLYQTGNLGGSLNALNEAVALGNIYPQVYMRMAIIHRKTKDYASELEVIDTAISLYTGISSVETSLRDFKKRKLRVEEMIAKGK